MLNSLYSSVSEDFRFKETPYVNFFTDPELSSSLYLIHLLSVFLFMKNSIVRSNIHKLIKITNKQLNGQHTI